jgi:MORN repeat
MLTRTSYSGSLQRSKEAEDKLVNEVLERIGLGRSPSTPKISALSFTGPLLSAIPTHERSATIGSHFSPLRSRKNSNHFLDAGYSSFSKTKKSDRLLMSSSFKAENKPSWSVISNKPESLERLPCYEHKNMSAFVGDALKRSLAVTFPRDPEFQNNSGYFLRSLPAGGPFSSEKFDENPRKGRLDDFGSTGPFLSEQGDSTKTRNRVLSGNKEGGFRTDSAMENLSRVLGPELEAKRRSALGWLTEERDPESAGRTGDSEKRQYYERSEEFILHGHFQPICREGWKEQTSNSRILEKPLHEECSDIKDHKKSIDFKEQTMKKQFQGSLITKETDPRLVKCTISGKKNGFDLPRGRMFPVYSGEVDRNGKYEGYGTLRLGQQVSYEGYFRRGVFHGRGTEFNTGQEKTEASVKEGPLEGENKLKEGVSLDWGKWIKYEGEFNFGRKQGFGKMEFGDGSWFEGCFKEGKGDGIGLFRASWGAETMGSWRNGQLVACL